jgi:hypothetical protein
MNENRVLGPIKRWSANRKLRGTAVSQIAAFPQGSVGRVVGRVVPRYAVPAPLTGRPCVAWRVWMRWDSTGTGSTSSTPIHEVSGCEFGLDDGSGIAIVDPRSATVTVIGHQEAQMLGDPEGIEAYLAKFGVTMSEFMKPQMKYFEHIIAPGDDVAVAGEALLDGTTLRFMGGATISDAPNALY